MYCWTNAVFGEVHEGNGLFGRLVPLVDILLK